LNKALVFNFNENLIKHVSYFKLMSFFKLFINENITKLTHFIDAFNISLYAHTKKINNFLHTIDNNFKLSDPTLTFYHYY